MPRFLSCTFLSIVVSVVLLLSPLTNARGEQPATSTTKTKQQKAAPGSGSKASAPVKAASRAAHPHQPTAVHSAATSATNKTSQTAHLSKPAKRTSQAHGAGKAASPAKQQQVAHRQPVATPKTTPALQTKKAKKKSMARNTARPAATAANSTSVSSAPLGIEQQISARSAIILDAKSGAELFAKYPDNPRQPASTIKIVTAMIAIKSLKNNEIVDISNHAASMPSSKVFLETSKQYQVNDLINAVLLASANDASVALAEKVAGSEENFANLMTVSARMWGARNTVCRTASGLTALGQQTTSRDLATIFRYAMQHDEFAQRMHEKFITTSYGKVLRNHNKALWRLDGALGGKTGYTVAARQTYVGQFSRDNQTIVVALMGSETMWADLAKLVEYGFKKQKDGQLARVSANPTG